MAEKAIGPSMRVVVQCFNDKGEMVSDIPGGGWYGFQDNYTMNLAANSIAEAIVERSKAWNEIKYGPAKKAV